MRKLINFTILCLILSGCASNIKKSRITYLFPVETENSISEFLKGQKSKFAVFYFERVKDNPTTKVHVETFKSKEALETALSNSTLGNRYVFIDYKYYPVLFDYDFKFYSNEKNGKPQVSVINEANGNQEEKDIPALTYRMKNQHLIGYKKNIRIIDWSNYVIIDDKGNIVENGL
ncbi:hypothetical protein [Ulvibacterium marinum]|uniref:Lipoprotein n=1 Tax=Ulvibacterium marinum TaxID=2419782 RepID=A0A3B0C2A1_9FLAO|nr:hypothetical protein [Ulvibacterium marinum]RKN77817.1 hypothetical protein D7Z94_21490 [Ulvibacterium marinum]